MLARFFSKIKIIAIILSILFATILLGFFILKNFKTSNNLNIKNIEKIASTSQSNLTANDEDKVKEEDMELYKDPSNYPSIVGDPIIKDIDSDGLIEKVVRYNLSMADRSIQVLYIYKNINNEYKLEKTFFGDPYGFAKLTNENIITVGKFIPNTNETKNWDDFQEFEITKYKWVKNGVIELNKELISCTSTKNLSEKIKINFN